MVKTAIAVMPVWLALSLIACEQEKTADKVLASDDTPMQGQTIRIAAAANLSDVLPRIIAGYQADKKSSTQKIEVTYASSGKLYAQITAGAPYDIFLSANQALPIKLAQQRLTDETVKPAVKNTKNHHPFAYTQGQLALYSVTKPLDGLTLGSLKALFTTKSANSKVTIANPALAPYGQSAKALLKSQHLYDLLTQQQRVIQAENIGQAFQYAHTGNVDYGFVAQSQLVAANVPKRQFMTLPTNAYPAIIQAGLVITDAPAAIDFTNYLQSSAGQQYFSDAGYLAVH